MKRNPSAPVAKAGWLFKQVRSPCPSHSVCLTAGIGVSLSILPTLRETEYLPLNHPKNLSVNSGDPTGSPEGIYNVFGVGYHIPFHPSGTTFCHLCRSLLPRGAVVPRLALLLSLCHLLTTLSWLLGPDLHGALRPRMTEQMRPWLPPPLPPSQGFLKAGCE